MLLVCLYNLPFFLCTALCMYFDIDFVQESLVPGLTWIHPMMSYDLILKLH